MFDSMLSILIFLPIVAGALVLIAPLSPSVARSIGFAVSLIVLALGIMTYQGFQSTGGYEFVESYYWIKSYGISYTLGIDGISLMILMLVALLFPVAFLLLWNDKSKGYWGNMLLVQGAMVGTLSSLDLILFYVFWEVMLIPIFFMIGLYGGANRYAAAVKITVYTMVGSLFMFVAILYLAYSFQTVSGVWSFALEDLTSVSLTGKEAFWVFAAFMLAFAIKIPLFPLHTWLPDAYTEAPTGATFILSAIMAKLGIYAVIRFVMPVYPQEYLMYATPLIVLGLIGMVYCGIAAIKQQDVKRMLAYSSASHLGIIAVGIFALNTEAMVGSVYQIVAHAMATGVLFLLVGLLEERLGTRNIDSLGGIAKVAPVYATFFAVAMLASCGLPGTNGFIGEFLIILGTFKYHWLLGTIAATSVLVGVAYMLWMYQRVIFQKTNDLTVKFADLNGREIIGIAPVLLLIIYMGIHPQPFLKKIEPSVERYISQISQPQSVFVAEHSVVKGGQR
ncbi:complex I subunit 4 family protein [Chrysiogenes arsenatis]|uniref:complex I subunit 4 family protein n=1 Tax=Chrysiogenes arsenatis TaxID=309797 RepID=UPI000416E915|nr:NADH-quinone oxidoreductase subunit M [Chrysiogenes arsenatis]